MTTKSRRRLKLQHPPVSVAQTTGTVPTPAAPAAEKAPIDKAMEDFEAVRKGIARLTSPTAEFHRMLGKQLLQGLAHLAPKLIASVHAARRGWRKPDAEAKRRAKALAKTWGV